MKSKEEIEYEGRIKKRFLILKDLLSKGKVNIVESLEEDLKRSFNNVQFDKNGEPIIESIDGKIRSMALMAEHIDHREKMKSAVSLTDIQNGYFSRVEGNFNEFYKTMIEYNSDPHQIASTIAYGNSSIDYINDAIDPIVENLEQFWKSLAEPAYIHLEDDYDSIKAVFGGDLFPAHDENIASKCGIYTDTIILPCPFIRSRHMFKIWNKEQRVYYAIKFALNLLQYKTLALSDFKIPIVAVLADKEMIDEFSFEQVKEIGDKDALYHASKIFDRKFENTDDLIAFGKGLDTIEKVIKEIKDPEKVLFDTEFKEPLNVQLKNQMEGQSKQLMGTSNPGIIVSAMGLGRMGVCNELLMKSAKIGGVPLIDAPTSWEYFKWKLQYDAERAHPETNSSELHIVKGLNGLNNTNLNWIGKIPPNGLIELRKNGAINEIREILSTGINDLVTSNEFDFTQTSHKVFNNLNFAFNQHQENIKALINKKWTIAGRDFGSWLVAGTLEITAACVGTPLFGVSTVVLNQLMDTPKFKDLPKSVEKMKNLDKQKDNLKKSPIGLMFKYK